MRVPGGPGCRGASTDGDEPGCCACNRPHGSPRVGLWGRAYWYAMFPFHVVIFAGMARSITRHAEAPPRCQP